MTPMSLAVFQSIGPLELLIVLGIVLVIFGPKRLPALGRQLGAGMREFKDSITRKADEDDEDEDEDDADAESRRKATAALGRSEDEPAPTSASDGVTSSDQR
jgi:sec-independent protein translocase protein TatA